MEQEPSSEADGTQKNSLCFLGPKVRGVFRPRQTRQLPRAVDLKGRLLSCQSY